MKTIFSSAFLFAISILGFAQSYAPQVGTTGTTAIHKDSDLFVGWANRSTILRGPQDIATTESTYATVGQPEDAIGKANGTIVSLGDGGTAILEFEYPIRNGIGADFAVFENGFISVITQRAFLELAFVEVSSDGIHYFRFPAVNEYPSDFIENATDPGGSGFASMDARYLHNFAGKYILNYGTPFDLSDLVDDPLLDKEAIRYVKIIDVVGTNALPHRTYDSMGNIAIDPYPTPFASSGFDLDAVGVIHQNRNLSQTDLSNGSLRIYPNPSRDYIHLTLSKDVNFSLYNTLGVLVQKGITKDQKINITTLPVGTYFLELLVAEKKLRYTIIKK